MTLPATPCSLGRQSASDHRTPLSSAVLRASARRRCGHGASASIAPATAATTVRRAVITVAGLPRIHRASVEQLLLRYVHSAPLDHSTAVVDYDAAFFTRWSRGSQPGTVECRQLMSGTPSEIAALNDALAALATDCPGATASCYLI